MTINDERRIVDDNALDPPPHRLDKQMDNLKKIELKIPVSNLDDDSFKIKIQLVGE